MRRNQSPIVLFNGVGATGWSEPIFIGDWRHKIITLGVTGQDNASDTIVVQFATSDGISAGVKTTPTFTSAATYANMWDYDRVTNKNSKTTITADTGFTFTNSNTVERFIMEDDASQWLACNLSTYTDSSGLGLLYGHISLTNDAE